MPLSTTRHVYSTEHGEECHLLHQTGMSRIYVYCMLSTFLRMSQAYLNRSAPAAVPVKLGFKPQDPSSYWNNLEVRTVSSHRREDYRATADRETRCALLDAAAVLDDIVGT
jgi:hypothetical protein